jgi:chemotaxis protein MotB
MEPTISLVERTRTGTFAPWLLLLAAAGGAGYFFFAVHQPLREKLREKEAALGAASHAANEAKAQANEASAQAEEAKAQLDAAHTSYAELQKSEAEAREDLARAAAQRGADQTLIEQLKKEAGGAEVKSAAEGITVTLVDKILFKSGEAALTPTGEALLARLGGVLKNADKLIEVSGHADTTPVKSEIKQLYPTNWELSTARATNVVRFLQDQVGVKPRRLMAAGFGSARPVASNATVAGRAKNRRIEILLLPDKQKVVKGDFAEELAPPKSERAQVPAGAHAKLAARRK